MGLNHLECFQCIPLNADHIQEESIEAIVHLSRTYLKIVVSR